MVVCVCLSVSVLFLRYFHFIKSCVLLCLTVFQFCSSVFACVHIAKKSLLINVRLFQSIPFSVMFFSFFLVINSSALHVISFNKRKPMQTRTKISQRFDHIFQLSVQVSKLYGFLLFMSV